MAMRLDMSHEWPHEPYMQLIYRLQILLLLHYLHIVYIGILICIGTVRNNVRNKDKKKLKD